MASETIQTYLSKIPILPGLLSHSLSAQYLLSYNVHLDAVLKTDFSVIQEYPLHSFGRDHLMSLIVAKS